MWTADPRLRKKSQIALDNGVAGWRACPTLWIEALGIIPQQAMAVHHPGEAEHSFLPSRMRRGSLPSEVGSTALTPKPMVSGHTTSDARVCRN